jgi:hypothetical protein
LDRQKLIERDQPKERRMTMIAAAAGATFDNELTASLEPSQNGSSGFWRVV